MEKKNQPLVSVVIPCYNHERFVQDCIQSVIDQTYENIELIIIDDGSKDHSVEKIQTMISKCEKRFARFEFRGRPNKGLSSTLNEALDWCNGEYYSAIASDDMYVKTKIEKQIKFLVENLNILAVSGNIKEIDEFGNIGKSSRKKEKKYTFEDIFLGNYFLPAPSALISMSVIREVGGYNEKTLLEDLYMWLKIAKYGDVYLMGESFSFYRRHGSNISGNIDLMNSERMKLVEFFSDNELYEKAKLKMKWLNFKGSRFYGFNVIIKSALDYFVSFIKYCFKISI